MRTLRGTAAAVVCCIAVVCAAESAVGRPSDEATGPSPGEAVEPDSAEAAGPGLSEEVGQETVEAGQDVAEKDQPNAWPPFEILGGSVEPGTKARLVLRSSESFAGGHIETPVAVIRGAMPGPTLCLVAGVHGDEVNGVEIVRRVVRDDKRLENLRGTVVAVPIANLSAFRRGSRYLPDRRDLNRYFPGRIDGSSASRIAFRLFDSVIRRCDLLIDLHTGSFHRTNLHQVRADLVNDKTADLAHAYGAEVIVNNAGRPGTLRRAANDVGVPAITVEAGEPARFNEQIVEAATRAVSRLIYNVGMSDEAPGWLERTPPPTAYWITGWVRCNNGGILVSQIELGDTVEEGAVLGIVSDPVSDEVDLIRAPVGGRIIGMALDQLVMPGFAAYHIARDASHNEEQPLELFAEDFEEPEGVDLEERPE